MLSSMLPTVTSSAAIPDQVLTLSFSPLWVPALFLAALTLACGALWFLAQADRVSRRARAPREEAPALFVARGPLHHEPSGHAA